MARMNLPNSITLARLGLTAVYLIAACNSGAHYALGALIAFTVAAATDWLDGYLARKLGQVTALGKLLDPLVDKILVCSAFVHLSTLGLCPLWVTTIIMAREFLITGLRQLAMERGVVIAADQWGKLKTIAQICFIVLALLWQVHVSRAGIHNTSPDSLWHWLAPHAALSMLLLWSALLLTLLSAVNYLRHGRALFQDRHD